MQVIKSKIDIIYKQIKINEIIESEEQLRNKELEQQKSNNNKNFEKTLFKLNMVNKNDIIWVKVKICI